MPEWWNRVREWLERGEERPVDPQAMVDAAVVNLAISAIIVTRLEASGIKALSMEERSVGGRGLPMARVLCPAGQLVEARRIIDDVVTH